MSCDEQRRGTFLFSIDLPTLENGHRRFPQAANQLLEVLDSFDVPATWAVDAADRSVIKMLQNSSAKHEIALSGTDSADRRREIAALLVRAKMEASRSGLTTSTITVDSSLADSDFDLLAKHGFSTVCPRPANQSAAQSRGGVQIRSLRFGVWEVELSATLGESPSMPSFWRSMQIHRGIRAAARKHTTFHLGLDGRCLEKVQPFSTGKLERILTCVADCRDKNTLRCITLRDVAEQMQQRTTSRSAVSILRAA